MIGFMILLFMVYMACFTKPSILLVDETGLYALNDVSLLEKLDFLMWVSCYFINLGRLVVIINPIELVYKSLTGIVIIHMPEPEKVQGKCSCCERSAEAFDYYGYKIA